MYVASTGASGSPSISAMSCSPVWARTYSSVLASGGTMPLLAPASTAMLQMVIRSSMLIAATASPQNSIAQ